MTSENITPKIKYAWQIKDEVIKAQTDLYYDDKITVHELKLIEDEKFVSLFYHKKVLEEIRVETVKIVEKQLKTLTKNHLPKIHYIKSQFNILIDSQLKEGERR